MKTDKKTYRLPFAFRQLFLSLVLAIWMVIPSQIVLAQSLPPARYQMDEVVVTASRFPTSFLDAVRFVTVFDSADIADAPVQSIQGLLLYSQGVNLRQRGPLGVQADIGIRGSTFEQTMVLLNGMKITDPQTGHHQLNIPVTLQDVERVEILHGQGSSIYGPNAFGGVVNIITNEPGGNTLSTKVTGGDNGFVEGLISSNFQIGGVRNRFSLSKSVSNGYRHNTDFDILTITNNSLIKVGNRTFNLMGGYSRRIFGANDFYASNYPNQHEDIKTGTIQVTGRIPVSGFEISPGIYWRRNNDEFLLDFERPEWYRNRHRTDVIGVEIQIRFRSRFGSTAIIGEAGREIISSNSLGDHQRNRGGISLEQQIPIGRRVNVVADAFAYYHSGWGWQVWPGLGMGVKISPNLQVVGNIGQAYRVPNFTELYYDSPANVGNPELQPEQALSYETGLKWLSNTIIGNVSVFQRKGTNLIDWGRNSADEPWLADNISEVTTSGAEASLKLLPAWSLPLRSVDFRYGYLYSDLHKVDAAESKYVLTHPEHNLIADFTIVYPLEIRQRLSVRRNVYANSGSQQVVDTRISRTFNTVRIFLDITNLFDTDFEIIEGIPMPGRWARFGIETHLNGSSASRLTKF